MWERRTDIYFRLKIGRDEKNPFAFNVFRFLILIAVHPFAFNPFKFLILVPAPGLSTKFKLHHNTNISLLNGAKMSAL